MALTLALAVLMIVTPGTRAEACEGPFVRKGVLADVRPGLPSREAVRVIGLVTGYGAVSRGVGQRMDVGRAATLRLRIQDVVSGRVDKGETEVVSVAVSADCSSVGQTRDRLEEMYKVGTSVVVFGESVPGFNASPTAAIVAEWNQGGFVRVIPGDLQRVATGEVDFGRLNRSRELGHVLEFEFDRALLGLANAPSRERFARLLNLADYPYSFHAFRQADRKFFSRLVSDSGVTAAEARRLFEHFDRQDADRRTFFVVTQANVPGAYSVYIEFTDDLPGAANRSSRVGVYRLTDSLYLRVVPQGHVAVERGAFAYAIQLSRDAAGDLVILPTNQPRRGLTADYLRAADFRNSDNTGPNEIGPKNVNAAGEFREVQFADYGLEIRVLSFEIIGVGPSRVPAFARVSCLVTVRARGR